MADNFLTTLQKIFVPNQEQQRQQQLFQRFGPNWKQIVAQKQAQADLDAQRTIQQIRTDMEREKNIAQDTKNKRIQQLDAMKEVYATVSDRLPSNVKSFSKFLDLPENALEDLTGAASQINQANKDVAQLRKQMTAAAAESRAAAGEVRAQQNQEISNKKSQLDITLKQQQIDKNTKALAANKTEEQKRARAQKAIDDYKIRFAEQGGVETDPITLEQRPMMPVQQFIMLINKQFGFGFKNAQERDDAAAQAFDNRDQQNQEPEDLISQATDGDVADDNDPQGMTIAEGFAHQELQDEVVKSWNNRHPNPPLSNAQYWNVTRLAVLKAYLEQQKQQGQ